MCDRTQEFLQCVDLTGGVGNGIVTVKKRVSDVTTRTAFHDAASDIAKGVHRTSGSLMKLTKVDIQKY